MPERIDDSTLGVWYDSKGATEALRIGLEVGEFVDGSAVFSPEKVRELAIAIFQPTEEL